MAVVDRFADAVDLALYHGLLNKPGRVRATPAATRIAELEAFLGSFDVDAALRDVDEFFRLPATPRPRLRARGMRHGAAVHDLTWASELSPFFAETREALRAERASATVHARAYRRGAGRPAVVLVHGYLGGDASSDARIWGVRAFLDAGLDVILLTLPGHGPRKGLRRFTPTWPGPHMRLTLEGHRRAVSDVRGAARWARSVGAPAVGVVGMSLGGYVTALTATAAKELDFVVPFVPLASVADFMRDGDQFPGSPAEKAEQHALFERANAITSPLARPPRVKAEGRAVLVGARDRITPSRQGARIAAHFEVPLTEFRGGHLVQIGRGPAFRDTFEAFRTAGVLP